MFGREMKMIENEGGGREKKRRKKEKQNYILW